MNPTTHAGKPHPANGRAACPPGATGAVGTPRPTDLFRAFVAVELGAEARDAVRGLQRQLDAVLPRGGVRWTKPDQLHLTLWFLGDVPASRLPELTGALGAALRGAARLSLRLDGLGAFPSTRAPRVLWVGLEGDLPQLLDVQVRVAQAAGPFGDHHEMRAFHPHLTLGRVNRPEAAVGRAFQGFVAQGAAPAPCPWEVGMVRLIRSQLRPTGAEYSELARFGLG